MAKRTGRRVSRKRNTSRKYSKKRYSKKRYSKKRYSKRVSRKRYSKRVSRRKTKRKVMVGGESPNSDVGETFRVLASSTGDSGRINKWVDWYTGYNLRKITVERSDGGSIAIEAGATKKSTGKNIHLKYYKDPVKDGEGGVGTFKFKLIPIDGDAAEADLRDELAGNKEWSVSTEKLAARAKAASATREEVARAKSFHNMDDEFRDLIVRGELSTLKEINFDADTAPERTAWMTAITNLKSNGQGTTRGEETAPNQKYFSGSSSGLPVRRDYLDAENDAINLARYSGEKSVFLPGGLFEVCFGENLNTDYGRLDSEPPSRMWQVNTKDQNTRVVDVIPEPEPSPQTEPEPPPQTEPSPQTEPEPPPPLPSAVPIPPASDAIQEPPASDATPGPPIVSLGNEWDLFRGPLPEGDDIQGRGGIMMTLEEATKECSENSAAHGFTVSLASETPIGEQVKYKIWIKDNKNKEKSLVDRLMPGWQSFTKKEKIWL